MGGIQQQKHSVCMPGHLYLLLVFVTAAASASLTPTSSPTPTSRLGNDNNNSSDMKTWQRFYDMTGGDCWIGCRPARTNPCNTTCFRERSIVCDSQDHIILMHLTFKNLTGDFAALSGLTHLTSLVLSNNHITGPLEALATLTNLGRLELSSLNISQSLFPLSGLTKLTLLSMMNSQLTGTLSHLMALTQLTSVGLPHNNLTGTLTALSNLTNLLYFDVSRNCLTGSLSVLSGWTKLTFIALSNNKLTGSLSPLAAITSLEDLSVSNNTLSGHLTPLSQLTRLSSLDVSFNNFEGPLPGLSFLQGLKFILLNNNKLSGSIPPRLCSREQTLFMVDISANQLTGTIPPLINQTNIISLDLSNNLLTGTIPPLDQVPQLQVLILGSNKLSGTIPSPDRLTLLTVFDLSINSLSGTIPNLSLLPSLMFLNLAQNQLTGTIPSLSNATYLSGLALFDNQLSGTLSPIPRHLIESIAADMYGTDGFIFVHNNFLSCELPIDTVPSVSSAEQDNANINQTHTMLAIGNRFSLDLRHKPKWLSQKEIGASQLFVSIPAAWKLLLVKCAVLAAVLVVCVWVWWWRCLGLPLSLLLRVLFVWGEGENQIQSTGHTTTLILPRDPLMSLLRLCVCFTVALSALCVIGLLPLYVMASNLYQCGETLARMSVSYTINSRQLEHVIAVLTCVFQVCVSIGVAWLYGLGRVAYVRCGVSVSRAPGTHWLNYSYRFSRALTQPFILQQPAVELVKATNDAHDTAGHSVQFDVPPTCELPPTHVLDQQSSTRSSASISTSALSTAAQTPQPTCPPSPAPSPASSSTSRDWAKLALLANRTFRISSGATVWTISLLLMSVPSILYEVLGSLPDDNVLGLNGLVIPLVQALAVPLLVVLNGFVVPVLSAKVISVSFGSDTITVIGQRKALTRLVLVTRLFMLVVVPVVVVIMLDNGCMQFWKYLWRPCRDSNDQTFRKPFYFVNFVAYSTSKQLRAPSSQDLCVPRYDRNKAVCARRVVEIVSPLMISHMMLQALLFPVVVLVWHGGLRPYIRSKLLLPGNEADAHAVITARDESDTHTHTHTHTADRSNVIDSNKNNDSNSADNSNFQFNQSNNNDSHDDDINHNNSSDDHTDSNDFNYDDRRSADVSVGGEHNKDHNIDDNNNCSKTDSDCDTATSRISNIARIDIPVEDTLSKHFLVDSKLHRTTVTAPHTTQSFNLLERVNSTTHAIARSSQHKRMLRALLNRALSPPQLDNFGLMTVTWVEVGIVYGCMAPLVLLAVSFTLIIQLRTCRILAAAHGHVKQSAAATTATSATTSAATNTNAYPFSFSASSVCPPLAYLVLSVIVQCVIITWFYASTKLAGWQLVVVVAPITCLCLCLHMLTRVGDMWVVVVVGGVVTCVWRVVMFVKCVARCVWWLLCCIQRLCCEVRRRHTQIG